jgi:hypothetical protein
MNIKGYDTKGRPVVVKFDDFALSHIPRIEVGERGAVICDYYGKPDISISLKDWRELKPLLSAKTKIVEA